MLKLSDLVDRPDIRLGPLQISPSRRLVEGPEGSIHPEPLVMHVFLLLLDARGRVVMRNELFDRCWGGAAVGDDSLNRAIAGVRRIAADTAPGLFAVETVPRTGYRLTGDLLSFEEGTGNEAPPAPQRTHLSRRAILGAAAVGLGGLGAFAFMRERQDPRVSALVEKGRQAILYGNPARAQGLDYFRQAVKLAPNDASVWGWLAVAYRNVAENAGPGEVAAAVQACREAADRALSINNNEANALAALATLQPFLGDWPGAEARLKSVLAKAPTNFLALDQYTILLQAAGYNVESWEVNERAIQAEPLSPLPQYKRALKHWILGRAEQADLAIDRALELWPRHPAVWNTRLMLFAYTGRGEAALNFMNDERSRPRLFSPQMAHYWRTSITGLSSRAKPQIERARTVNLAYAKRSPGFATWAIMTTSMLGELDAAFEIARGYLLRRGPGVGSLLKDSGEMPINDHRWRRTMNLFTPATAAMRADPRFLQLCDGIDLSDYWAKRGKKPDYQLRTV